MVAVAEAQVVVPKEGDKESAPTRKPAEVVTLAELVERLTTPPPAPKGSSKAAEATQPNAGGKKDSAPAPSVTVDVRAVVKTPGVDIVVATGKIGPVLAEADSSVPDRLSLTPNKLTSSLIDLLSSTKLLDCKPAELLQTLKDTGANSDQLALVMKAALERAVYPSPFNQLLSLDTRINYLEIAKLFFDHLKETPDGVPALVNTDLNKSLPGEFVLPHKIPAWENLTQDGSGPDSLETNEAIGRVIDLYKAILQRFTDLPASPLERAQLPDKGSD